jgi:hypothetical protein
MQYMLLIYQAEGSGPAPDTAAFGELMAGYRAFTEDVKAKGIMVAGDALEGIDNATTLRVRGARTEIVDGPFAETKEQLGGFYILDCKDLDEALGYAARIPSAKNGSIEVRPLLMFT